MLLNRTSSVLAIGFIVQACYRLPMGLGPYFLNRWFWRYWHDHVLYVGDAHLPSPIERLQQLHRWEVQRILTWQTGKSHRDCGYSHWVSPGTHRLVVCSGHSASPRVLSHSSRDRSSRGTSCNGIHWVHIIFHANSSVHKIFGVAFPSRSAKWVSWRRKGDSEKRVKTGHTNDRLPQSMQPITAMKGSSRCF